MTHFKTLEKLITDNELELPKIRSVKEYEALLNGKGIAFPDPDDKVTNATPGDLQQAAVDRNELRETFRDVTQAYSTAARGEPYKDEKGRHLFRVDTVAERRALKKLKDFESHVRNKVKDFELLMDIFRFERSRRVIGVNDEYALFKYDAEHAELECECYREIPASGFHVEQGELYKYTKVFDSGRMMDMYTVYATRIISSDEQLSRKAGKRLDRGFEVKEEDYEDDYTQYRPFDLSEYQWQMYFREA